MQLIERNILPSRIGMAVHAASIVPFNGHLVMAWFEGQREGDPSVYIHIHNLHGNNDELLLGNKDNMPRWNPVLFTHQNRIYLFEKAGVFCDRWQTFLHDITDFNDTIGNKEIYQTAIVLPAGFNGPVKSKPIFENDTMYCGSSVETVYDWTSYIEAFHLSNGKLQPLWRSNPIYLPEKRTYSLAMSGQTMRTMGLIQPALWYDGDKLKAFFRSSYGLGRIYTSSASHPYTQWSDPVATSIYNPNSGMDVLQHDGRLFVVCNPSESDRFPLVLMELDASFNVLQSLTLDTQAESYRSPEVSYPYMIWHDGKIHCVYTYGRKNIVHSVIGI